MIRMLSGIIVDLRLGQLVLDVHGVGYLVSIQAGQAQGLTLGSPLTLYTYLAVREDALDLYGFWDRDTLEMFQMLIDLPKIGPKSALQILSQADVALIQKGVVSEDPAYLSKMSGMSKKTAEKIVLGLKDKFEGIDTVHESEHGDGDVIDALLTLGYSQKEARDAVSKLDPSIKNTNDRVREALRTISK